MKRVTALFLTLLLSLFSSCSIGTKEESAENNIPVFAEDPTPNLQPDKSLYLDNPGPQMKPDLDNAYDVLSYGAVGDGLTNDRAAIQAAIDAAAAAAEADGQPRTVLLPGGKTYLSGNLMLRSNLIFYLAEDAILKVSGDYSHYVNPLNGFEPEPPHAGAIVGDVNWSCAVFENYPFIYLTEIENITITGSGTIDCSAYLPFMIIGIYRVRNFEVSGIHIYEFNFGAITTLNCSNGYLEGLTIEKNALCGDGIPINSSDNIRVTNNTIRSGDDCLYVTTTYKDPRDDFWYSTDYPTPCHNIQIDNNHCTVTWDETKAFAVMPWGSLIPDQRDAEMHDIWVHDNVFQTMGVWPGHWDGKAFVDGTVSPIRDIIFENNTVLQEIQTNFAFLIASNMVGFDCMKDLRNGDFESTADVYWSKRGMAGATDEAVGQEGTWCGYLDCSTPSYLYEGLYLDVTGSTYTMRANVKGNGRVFLRDFETGELIFSQEFSAADWESIICSISIPAPGNYHVGFDRGTAREGITYVDSISFEKESLPIDGIIEEEYELIFDMVDASVYDAREKATDLSLSVWKYTDKNYIHLALSLHSPTGKGFGLFPHATVAVDTNTADNGSHTSIEAFLNEKTSKDLLLTAYYTDLSIQMYGGYLDHEKAVTTYMEGEDGSKTYVTEIRIARADLAEEYALGIGLYIPGPGSTTGEMFSTSQAIHGGNSNTNVAEFEQMYSFAYENTEN